MADYSRVGTACPSDENPTADPVVHGSHPEGIHLAAADDGSVQACTVSRWSCCHRLFPAAPTTEYKKMLKQLGVLSWPVVLYMVTTVLLSMTSIIFSGHLGKDEIVAASLGQSVIHVFWRAVLWGFASGADTLFAQTYGSKNKKRVGIILQRYLVVCMLLAIACWGILLNTEGILLLLGQDPYIARLASGYGMVFIAATPADVVIVLLIKYLECQRLVRPIVLFTAIMGGLNVLLHFILVSTLQYGLLGAVGAQAITFYMGAVMMFSYIYKRHIYKETWPGWSWECLQEWGTIMRLSVGGVGISCLDWVGFEACFFITGLYGKTEVGAHAVLFNTSNVTWSISSGFGIGAAIMIGNYLGAKKPIKAHVTASCCLVVTALLGILYMLFYLPFKDIIGCIFTKDRDVVDMVASIIPVVAVSEIFDSINIACYGILRGCGYQYIGAIVCFAGYVLGLPLGVALMFTYGYGLRGLWYGMLTTQMMQFALLNAYVLACINWSREVDKAQKRAAVLPVESKCGGEIPLRAMENHVDDTAVKTTTQLDEDGSERNCNGAPDEEDHRDRNGNVEDVGEVVLTRRDSSDETQDGDSVERREADAHPEDRCSVSEEEHEAGHEEEKEEEFGVLTLHRLSVTQLILRRGLALIFCTVPFIVSIYISVYVVPAVRPVIPDLVNATVNSTLTDWYVTESVDTST